MAMDSIFLWVGISIFFLLLLVICVVILVIIGKKTHGVIEFKAWMGGNPIALFFQENRYCHWKVIKPEAGIVEDKDYGGFIINEKGTYIDKVTKNVLIPFDTSFASSLNVHSCKLIEDLHYVFNNEEELKAFKQKLDRNEVPDSIKIPVLNTTVHFGAVKSIMNALLPHNINAKIIKTIASRTGRLGGSVQGIIMYILAFLAAVGMGVLMLKMMGS